MGIRFFRRVRIAPGLTLNLSRRGASVSVGQRGARATVGQRGVRTTLGAPGTGLSWTKQHAPRGSGGAGRAAAAGRTAAAGRGGAPGADPQGADPLAPGLLARLRMSPQEKAFVAACRALRDGPPEAVAPALQSALPIGDAHFLLGLQALDEGRPQEAAPHLQAALASGALGQSLARFGAHLVLDLDITPEIGIAVAPDPRIAELALIEALQHAGAPNEAFARAKALLGAWPAEPVVQLSFAELVMSTWGDAEQAALDVVTATEGLTNEDALQCAGLLYRARALRQLGQRDAARRVLTLALRRTRDRPPGLLHALRYERALVYEDEGQQARARKDLERILAEDAGYRDVAARLGLRSS